MLVIDVLSVTGQARMEKKLEGKGRKIKRILCHSVLHADTSSAGKPRLLCTSF